MTSLAHLWWHLMDVHGLDVGQTHGDPELMHAWAHAFGPLGHTHAEAES